MQIGTATYEHLQEKLELRILRERRTILQDRRRKTALRNWQNRQEANA